MAKLSLKRHRLPPIIIRYAVWLYFRFSLSLRDVEELLAQRGVDVTYETIRCWTNKFGPQIAKRLRARRHAPSPRWHLDETVSSIGGKQYYIWRAVDDENEVLDLVVQKERDTRAALKLLKRLLRNQPVEPERIATDGLRSYPAALHDLGLLHLHRPGRLRDNNRAENSICRSEDEGDRCSTSSPPHLLSVFSPLTERSTVSGGVRPRRPTAAGHRRGWRASLARAS